MKRGKSTGINEIQVETLHNLGEDIDKYPNTNLITIK